MKSKEFKNPAIFGEKGNMQFVLFDNTITKSFFNALDFDRATGCFPIINKNCRTVEYMDLIGNFTKKPTKFAKEFYDYLETRCCCAVSGCACYAVYRSYLIDFPSKYMIDPKVRTIVKNEEKYRYIIACKSGDIRTLIMKLRSKLYLRKLYLQKVRKAERLKKKMLKQGRKIQEIYELTI